MRRQVITGGAIVVISVASAAAYGIVQGGWFNSAMPRSAAQVETVNAAFTSASQSENLAEAPAWPEKGAAASGTTPATSAQQSITVAQMPVQQSQPGTARPLQASPPPQAAAPPVPAKPAIACANPNAMGVARVVEIDTSGGPGFGSQHFKTYDFLRDHEVALTFDDGPWPNNTQAVLKALADQCLRATFFPIGKHATYHPEILKQVIAAGHTVGSHTWSHADLEAVLKKSGPEAATEEIEKGASAVRMMAGAPTAPFFRFPDLRHPPEMLTYLGGRNIASFSTDIDSFDFKIKRPEELTRSLVGKLNKLGKGIILMHDFQKVTSIALPQILGELQKNGFKVVHMVPKGTLTTLPQYDEAVLKENKLPTMSDNKPTESVVRTISGQ
jgi:peptidoglycan/xylan/chitin deacetylase (PgdA/CDA1 family)